jgi:hypothetical protein
MSKFDETLINLPRNEHESRRDHDSPSCRSSVDGRSTRKSPLGDLNATAKMERDISVRNAVCCGFAGLLCIMFNKEDCRKIEESELEPNNEDDALFCTLCNAEVAYGLSETLYWVQPVHVGPIYIYAVHFSCPFICTLVFELFTVR